MIVTPVEVAWAAVGVIGGQFALNLLSSWIVSKKFNGHRGNGYCRDHVEIARILGSLENSHKDEKRVDMIATAVRRVMEENGVSTKKR